MNKRILQNDENSTLCVFCEKLEKGEIIFKNDRAFAVLDAYPVTPGHTLVLPIRHVADYFDLSKREISAMDEIVRMRRQWILEQDPTVSGFNIGVNCGEDAGQTVYHCHVHLIPRRKGDTPDPRGGVRGIIPGKMSY
jgi:ATP adenylyltransferase